MKKTKINSLYIHIPFCKNICPYCDFLKLLKNNDFENKYVDRLIKDLSSLEDRFFNFKTIFIGGGTPSSLSKFNLERLLKKLNKFLDKDYEFSIEVNPEDINEDFLKLIKKYGLNRISIGVQTFNKDILKSINRDYNIDFIDLIKLVKKYIDNINLDFIYGLPNQDEKIIKDDLNKVIQLDVTHLSFYSLTIDQGSIYYVKKLKEIDSNLSRKYYDLILNTLKNNGYNRYEVSNFSKPNYECKHNLTYWHNEQYVALGIGASGYENNIRYTNTKNIQKYIDGINERDEEIIDDNLLEEYFLITNLRLSSGFEIEKFNKLFKKDFLSFYREEIENLIDRNLIIINNNRCYCSDEGLMLLDIVLLKLIKR